MNSSEIASRLSSISGLAEQSQLDELQRLVDCASLAPACQELTNALFGVFERFPNHDGFGIFWSVLHVLEAIPDTEVSLIESVRRCATEFNVLMVNRLLNGGRFAVGEVSLLGLLEEVAATVQVSAAVRQEARESIERHSLRRVSPN